MNNRAKKDKQREIAGDLNVARQLEASFFIPCRNSRKHEERAKPGRRNKCRRRWPPRRHDEKAYGDGHEADDAKGRLSPNNIAVDFMPSFNSSSMSWRALDRVVGDRPGDRREIDEEGGRADAAGERRAALRTTLLNVRPRKGLRPKSHAFHEGG